MLLEHRHHRRRPSGRAGHRYAAPQRIHRRDRTGRRGGLPGPTSGRRCRKNSSRANWPQERLLIRPAHFYADHAIETHLSRAQPARSSAARSAFAWMTARACLTTSCCSQPAAGRARSQRSRRRAAGRALPAHLDGCRGDPRRTCARRGVSSSSAAATSGLKSPPPCASLALRRRVLEMADRTMNRVTCAEVSAFVQAEHARHGVDIVLQRARRVDRCRRGAAGGCARSCARMARSTRPTLSSSASALRRSMSSRAPRDSTAPTAFRVDEFCRTSDPRILAAGDCCHSPEPALRAPAAPGIGRQRIRAGHERRAQSPWNAVDARQGALVLVRSIRPQAHHRRLESRLRQHS